MCLRNSSGIRRIFPRPQEALGTKRWLRRHLTGQSGSSRITTCTPRPILSGLDLPSTPYGWRSPIKSPGSRGSGVADLLDRLKQTVGQEMVFQAPDEMGRASLRQYSLAIGDFNPLYSDRQYAQAHGLRDVMAPPTLMCDTWQYVDSDIDDRGGLLGRGAMGEPAALRAGNEYEFFQPIHPDDIITARWIVKDVYQRTGRSGVLIFQVIEMTFYNQRQELLARNTETMFYRPPEALPEAANEG